MSSDIADQDTEADADSTEFEHLQQALEINRVIHEPARLLLLAVLSKIDWADFNFLLTATRLSKGNLSKQSAKLEEAGYIEIEKGYKGKIPVTRYRITPEGKHELQHYWNQMSTLGHKISPDS